jgi:hypothetical protein
MSVPELQEVRRQLEELTELGFIPPSTSPYVAPVLVARKKDGTLRMCIDYRALNKIPIKNRYPLPRIDELLDQLHGSTIWSSLDCASGYHQVRTQEHSIAKTAFRTRYGSYELLVLPVGLTNAPSAFMAWMHGILRPFIDKLVVCFLDGIQIASRTPQEHLFHLEQVLLVPDTDKPFHVFADASQQAVGAVLMQDQGRGLQPVAFESRKLSPAERSCACNQGLEMLFRRHPALTHQHRPTPTSTHQHRPPEPSVPDDSAPPVTPAGSVGRVPSAV